MKGASAISVSVGLATPPDPVDARHYRLRAGLKQIIVLFVNYITPTRALLHAAEANIYEASHPVQGSRMIASKNNSSNQIDHINQIHLVGVSNLPDARNHM